MNIIYAKLGKVRATKKQYLKIMENEGEALLLQQETTFEKGTGLETFLFNIEDEEVGLAGYKINSQYLHD